MFEMQFDFATSITFLIAAEIRFDSDAWINIYS